MNIASFLVKWMNRRDRDPNIIWGETYLSSLYVKNIILLDKEYVKSLKENKIIKDKNYSDYHLRIRQWDNLKNMNDSDFKSKQELIVKNKGKIINVMNDSKFVKLFGLNLYRDPVSPIGINKVISIVNEHKNNLEGRKLSSQLLKPHYYFTPLFNERSQLGQNRHWIMSAYYFFKGDSSGNKFLDLYTEKLIKLFFRIQFIKKKKFLDLKLIQGYKIISNISVLRTINNHINQVSERTNESIRDLPGFPSIILGHKWVKGQLKQYSKMIQILRDRREGFFSGFYVKKRGPLKKLNRILLSNPFFKHTSFNLIIDLFVYNNKNTKIRKLKNIIMRRTMYKYMYSMYANSYQKVKETMNKPRFFFMNIIDPSSYNYYNIVMKYYEELVFRKKRSIMVYFCLLLLQLNWRNKNRNNFNENNIQTIYDYKKKHVNDTISMDNNLSTSSEHNNKGSIESNKKGSLAFKKRVFTLHNNIESHFSSYKLANHRVRPGSYDIHGNLLVREDTSKLDLNKKLKKKVKENRSRYTSYLKYLKEMERRSHFPVDMKTLTLWDNKGLKKSYKTPSGMVGVEKPNIKKNKFSYNKYKSRYLLDNNLNLNSSKDKGIFYSNKRGMIVGNQIPTIKGDNLMKVNPNLLKNENKYIKSRKENNLNLVKPTQNIMPKSEDNNINNTVIIKSVQRKKKDSLNMIHEGLSKEEHIKKNYLTYGQDNLYASLDASFYIKSNSTNNLTKIKEKRNLLFISNKNNNVIHSLKAYGIANNNNNLESSLIKSKVLWEGLDHSIIKIIQRYLNLKEKNIFDNNLNKIISLKGYGNIWYIFYFLGVIKREFNNINRDVLLHKNMNVLPYSYSKMDQNYDVHGDNMFEKENRVFNYNYKNKKMNIHLWPSFINQDSRNSDLANKIGYREEIFKPYYRYMIPFLIYKLYSTFIYIFGFKLPLFKIQNYLKGTKDSGIRSSDLSLFKFLSVKVLLDLLRYNYRSMITVKSKYYFLSKLRWYDSKVKKLYISNWLMSVRYLKRLRKPPKNFWLRFHKVASYYYQRVLQYAELDTRRKIFVPFVLYFEDLLFNIYGKWVIIRIWPLKRYYLSSFILAERILSLIMWRRKRTKRMTNYARITSRLMLGLRVLQVKKTYFEYIKESSSWPNILIERMREASSTVNYTDLESYIVEHDRSNNLNSYNLVRNNLSYYMPYLEDQYNLNWSHKVVKRAYLERFNFVYNVTKAFKNYIRKLTRNSDISGFIFRIKGKPGFLRNNRRSTYRTLLYGNVIAPRHSTIQLYKPVSCYLPFIRGQYKSHIDYALNIGKGINGAVSFKVWLYSTISADVHELLLHLVQIKTLYNQLINRSYPTYMRLMREVKYYGNSFPFKTK
jgi:hypothetical protein